MKRLLPFVFAMAGLLAGRGAPGGDWPQFRYDAGRTAASPEGLPMPLHLRWERHLPPPRPAFPGEVRLRFDASYEPVVLGRLMFVPSMVTDSVTALDTDTGAERWRFFAEGPVRFAPVAWEGSVYFASDDGCLYCVDAADGRLRWKFRGLPPGKSDRRVLGHGRLISLWPARGGPVLCDGVVYFGAGIWSTYGVAIHALDAKSGSVIWSNCDSNQIPRANMDHGVAHLAGLTPQGYLAILGEKLVVPCGAQLPAFLDRNTGKLGTYSMGWGGRNGLPKGTWFVAGAKNYLSHGGDLYDISRPNDERFAQPIKADFKSMLYPGGFTRLKIERTNQKDLGDFSQPIFSGNVLYENDNGVVAYDLAEARLQQRSPAEIAQSRPDDPYPDKWTARFAELWRIPTQLRAHIRAGGHLYLGGPGVVEAYALADSRGQPQPVWRATVEGTPQRMLAADGKLFVVTREGTIYAFGAVKPDAPSIYPLPSAPSPQADAWTKTAADILQATGVRDGYALVLGIGTGRLIEELLRQSNLDVIAVDRDAGKVDRLRQHLDRAGLYGARASAHVGDPLSYPLPPYLASLVVSENWADLGPSATPAFIEAIYHPLRPYGGTACVALGPAERETLARQIAESRLPGATARPVGDWLLLCRVGPLPGAADWSHAEADAANTGASEDRFAKAPLDLLWFDGPPRWVKEPGSTLVRICGGRMFIKSTKLHAIDVYTGRELWQTALDFPHRPSDQFIAVEDAIYLAGGERCVVLDPATGRKTGQVDLPAGLAGAWTNLRVWQGYLVGQCGKHLLCFHRHSGQLAWQRQLGAANLSVAVGGGKVFCAQLINKRRGEANGQQASTRALDVETGEMLWEVGDASQVRYSAAHDLVVIGLGVYRAKDGTLVARLPEGPKPAEKTPPESRPKPLFLVGQSLLVGTAESFEIYDLLTGERSGGVTTWTRRGCTIPRASANFVTTRFLGNAACIDLASRQPISFWNVRAACSNNVFPANGVVNMPSLTGGCTCNYLPVSQAYAPAWVFQRATAH